MIIPFRPAVYSSVFHYLSVKGASYILIITFIPSWDILYIPKGAHTNAESRQVCCPAEPNELQIKRWHPLTGVWHAVCVSDIEPSLNLSRPGAWKVSSLHLEKEPAADTSNSGRNLGHKMGTLVVESRNREYSWRQLVPSAIKQ